MDAMTRVPKWLGTAAVVVVALLASILLVAALESAFRIGNASSVFLVAVSVVALRLGTWPAVATATGAFVVYNFLFVDPRMTLTVSQAEELLTRLPDFRRAYEPDGLAVEDFARYGATVRTLRGFIGSYHDLVAAVRDILLPNPDVRQG